MRNMLMALAATAALSTVAFTAPASAGEVQTTAVNKLAAAIQNGEVKSDYSQYRRRYVQRRHYGPRRYSRYPRGYYRRDRGDALAAGALGLATGAIIGGALAQSQAQAAPTYGSNTHAYCAQRFKSYDPRSGTYLGYDGIRHPCP
jgi:hypothetical protein